MYVCGGILTFPRFTCICVKRKYWEEKRKYNSRVDNQMRTKFSLYIEQERWKFIHNRF